MKAGTVKKNERPATDLGNVFLVIELSHVRVGPAAGVSLVLSRPGGGSPFIKTWRAQHGILDAAQATDLTGYVSRAVMDNLVHWTGVQEVLGR